MRSYELVYRRSNQVRRRPAFSLVELLVVLGILIILCSIFIPYVGKMRETNKRVGCSDNLRQIHLALKTYADANSFELPRVPSDPDAPGTYVAFTGSAFVTPARAPVVPATATAPSTGPATRPAEGAATPRVGPDLAVSPPATAPATQPATGPATAPAEAPLIRPGKDAVQLNDVTASLWLIVRLGHVTPQAFICPSSSDTVDPMLSGGKRVSAERRSNFTSGRHLSYSYSSPYSAAPRFRLNSDTLPPDFAVMADKNPGVGQGSNLTLPSYNAPPLALAVANSRNHNRAGQNVLYVTGEVRFQNTPYCGVGTGWERDNIYTAYAADPVPADSVTAPQAPGVLSRNVGPAWANDSYLVPTEDE